MNCGKELECDWWTSGMIQNSSDISLQSLHGTSKEISLGDNELLLFNIQDFAEEDMNTLEAYTKANMWDQDDISPMGVEELSTSDSNSSISHRHNSENRVHNNISREGSKFYLELSKPSHSSNQFSQDSNITRNINGTPSSNMDFDGFHFPVENKPNFMSFPNGMIDHERANPKRLSKASIAILKNWLLENRDNPYPSSQIKQNLAKIANISVSQVSTWMTNVRKRHVFPILRGRKKAKTEVHFSFLESAIKEDCNKDRRRAQSLNSADGKYIRNRDGRKSSQEEEKIRTICALPCYSSSVYGCDNDTEEKTNSEEFLSEYDWLLNDQSNEFLTTNMHIPEAKLIVSVENRRGG